MAKKDKKKDPISLLLKVVIFCAVVAIAAFGITYAVDSAEKATLDQQQKAANERNAQAQANYQKALIEYNGLVGEAQQSQPWPRVSDQGWAISDLSDIAVEGTNETFTRGEVLLNSPLLLTNRWHGLPGDYNSYMISQELGGPLVSLMNHTQQKVQTSSRSLLIMPQVADSLLKLIETAASQEPSLEYYHVHQGYRSYDQQNELYQAEAAKHTDLSGVALDEKVLSKVNAPGTSEFQTGFAFEINLYTSKKDVVVSKNFQESDQGKWFTNNAWKEGIVFRFPTRNHPNSSWIDKSYKTGMKSNYDFYRWVGIPHATVMQGIAIETGDMSKQMVLEEYIDYLTQHNHIAVYYDGVPKYEIYRIPVDINAETITIPIPAGVYQDAMISYDNMGGVIVAVTLN